MPSRSWFYLTLWRGTPPEFTEEVGVNISESTSASANIITQDSMESAIKKAASYVSEIIRQEEVSTSITVRTEVVWYVG